MSIRILLSILVFGLGSQMPSRVAAADTAYSAPGLLSVMPYRGVYYERGRGGTGMFLDRSPRGDLFISFYASTEEGAPTYYLMQGMFEPSSDAARIETGVIGTSHPALYTSRGGECIEGADCPFQEPTRTAVNLPVEITWMTPRHASVVIGSKSFDFRAAEFASADGDSLANSRWLIGFGIGTQDASGHDVTAEALSIVGIDPLVGELRVSSNAPDGYVAPPSDADLYLVSCADSSERCYELRTYVSEAHFFETGHVFSPMSDSPYRLLLWYEAASNRSGMQVVRLEDDGVLGGLRGAFFAEVYLDGIQRIVGRGRRFSSADQGGGDVVYSLLLRKLPDAHVRTGVVCQGGTSFEC